MGPILFSNTIELVGATLLGWIMGSAPLGLIAGLAGRITAAVMLITVGSYLYARGKGKAVATLSILAVLTGATFAGWAYGGSALFGLFVGCGAVCCKFAALYSPAKHLFTEEP